PAGVAWLLMCNASTTWSGVRLCALNNCGSTLITTVRTLPPKGAGATKPGMEVKEERTYTLAMSMSSLLDRVGLLNTNCPMGKVEASKRRIKGGCEPAGKIACALLVKAVTSAAACAILVP